MSPPLPVMDKDQRKKNPSALQKMFDNDSYQRSFMSWVCNYTAFNGEAPILELKGV